MELALFALAAFATAWLLVRMVKRHKKKNEHKAPSRELLAFEEWILAEVEREVGKKVTTVSRVVMGKALRGDPDPDAVTAVEDAVAKVDVEFAKMAHEKDSELVLTISFEDGSRTLSRKRVTDAELPATVRADFERTAASRVFRTWDFPWARPR